MFSAISSILSFLSSDMAIDLGTANTLVYVPGRGIVLNEPSVVAFTNHKGNMTPYAFGHIAKRMLGKTHAEIKAIRPLKDGVIADFKGAEEMIKYFINAVNLRRRFFVRPLVIVCVPYGSTPVERRAIQEAVESAGAREVFLIEEPMAAAIGAGLPVTEPTGCMVVDIGGGTTEVGVISLGGVVIAKSVRIAGDSIDDAIIAYIRKIHNLLIGEATAEKVKEIIGTVYLKPEDEIKTLIVKGRDLHSGLPKEIELSADKILDSIKEPVDKIITTIENVLELTPAELSADIATLGLTLTGGGALLSGLAEVINKATGLPVHKAVEPLNCVAFGAGKALENLYEFRAVLFKQD